MLHAIIILIFLIILAYRIVKARRGNLITSNSDFLGAGRLLYPNHKTEFERFFNSFKTDKRKFISEYKDVLQDYDNFDLEKLKAIEVLYIFGDSKNLLKLIDWRGEENEREIEKFIGKLLNQKVPWTHTADFRAGNSEADSRDGDFVIDLFIQIDKDLQKINQRLIFFLLGWDAYVFTAVDVKSFEQIIAKFPSSFDGADELRK